MTETTKTPAVEDEDGAWVSKQKGEYGEGKCGRISACRLEAWREYRKRNRRIKLMQK